MRHLPFRGAFLRRSHTGEAWHGRPVRHRAPHRGRSAFRVDHLAFMDMTPCRPRTRARPRVTEAHDPKTHARAPATVLALLRAASRRQPERRERTLRDRRAQESFAFEEASSVVPSGAGILRLTGPNARPQTPQTRNLRISGHFFRGISCGVRIWTEPASACRKTEDRGVCDSGAGLQVFQTLPISLTVPSGSGFAGFAGFLSSLPSKVSSSCGSGPRRSAIVRRPGAGQRHEGAAPGSSR
jgi:hypothetical protein